MCGWNNIKCYKQTKLTHNTTLTQSNTILAAPGALAQGYPTRGDGGGTLGFDVTLYLVGVFVNA